MVIHCRNDEPEQTGEGYRVSLLSGWDHLACLRLIGCWGGVIRLLGRGVWVVVFDTCTSSRRARGPLFLVDGVVLLGQRRHRKGEAFE